MLGECLERIMADTKVPNTWSFGQHWKNSHIYIPHTNTRHSTERTEAHNGGFPNTKFLGRHWKNVQACTSSVTKRCCTDDRLRRSAPGNYGYIYVCMCACMCAYIHTYIHTYTHTYIHSIYIRMSVLAQSLTQSKL
jgi:hypothetical protein